MKLIIDVGNTNMKLGVYNNSESVILLECYTHTEHYEKIILSISREFNITNVYVGSVVPSINANLKNVLEKCFNFSPVFFAPEDFSNEFDLSTLPLKEIGIDILAFSLYLKNDFDSAVGICFGTAIFSVVINQGKLEGVMIAPSFDFGFTQLPNVTEKVTDVSVKSIQPNFGFNTQTAIESGYYHLYNGLIDSIGEYNNKKYNIENIIITGGKSKNINFIQVNDSKKKKIFLDNCVLTGLEYLSRSF